jgi:hypothetical protein
MFDVKMSVSRPCRISPLKYDAKGPRPVLFSFCKAMYLFVRGQGLGSMTLEKVLPIG